MQFTIHPYRTSRGMWTFIDPNTNRTEEENALVAGIDTMLDNVKSRVGDFLITFSDAEIPPFPACVAHMRLEWQRGDRNNERAEGNWYLDRESGVTGWLCPVLFDYFPEAPTDLYLYVTKA